MTYFGVNFPDEVIDRVEQFARSRPHDIKKLFYVDMIILDELLRSYQRDITRERARLKGIEQDKGRAISESLQDLHNLAVRWHSMSADLHDVQSRIKDFMEFHEQISQRLGGSQQEYALEEVRQMLSHIDSRCRFCLHWCMAYKERTNVRINLIFHLSAARENRAIAVIAQQTQRDSVSMFTLAVVTVVFLPPTFVAALFSTPFFNADNGGANISRKGWIMPAVAIPLTIFVVGAWLLWFQTRVERDEAYRAKLELATRSGELPKG